MKPKVSQLFLGAKRTKHPKLLERKALISVLMPPRYIDELDGLVSEGHYLNRSEAIRMAIHDLLLSEKVDVKYRDKFSQVWL